MKYVIVIESLQFHIYYFIQFSWYIIQILIIMPKTVRQVLSEYVKENEKVEYHLYLLVHAFTKFSNGIKEMTKMFHSKLDPIKYFKMLMLLHRCYLFKVFQPLPVINLLHSLKSPTKPINELQKMLCNRVIPQYTLYLQRCYSYRMEQMGQNSLQLEPSQQVYIKINLLKRALDFAQILYTFGRYYHEKYGFIEEYNVIVGIDVHDVYNQLKGILDNNQELLDDDLALEIEKLHERMYIVYYNCYFYKKCMMYEPEVWINIQSSQTRNMNSRQRYGTIDRKTKKKPNFEYLLTTAKSSNFSGNSSSDQKCESSSKTIQNGHKTILSNQQIEDILRICGDFNLHEQITEFNLMNEDTELPFQTANEKQKEQDIEQWDQKDEDEGPEIEQCNLENVPTLESQLIPAIQLVLIE